MTFEIEGDRVTLIYGGVNAGGRQEGGRQTFRADGVKHPMSEAPGMVAISTLSPGDFRTVGKKDGAVVGRATYLVSDEGRSMTATVAGVAAHGQPFDQVIVFDRE